MPQPDVLTRNRQLAQELIEEVRRNPQSIYSGKFVGIANGKVVVIADNLEELDRRLREAEPDPSKCFIVEPSRDYTQVVYI